MVWVVKQESLKVSIWKEVVFYLIIRFESQNLLIDKLSYTLKFSYPFLCLITSNDSFIINTGSLLVLLTQTFAGSF